MKPTQAGARAGRPRAFDVEEALDRALHVFWRKGYEGASLADLTEAMGINRPSLYSAFGNKEALFRKVMDRYAEGRACHVRAALAEPTARAVAERLLRAAAELMGDPGTPRGCLAVQGALACGDTAEVIRKEQAARRAAGEAALRLRFDQAVSEGDLPAGTDTADLARYVTTQAYGMAVQAADGASREQLLRVVDRALQAWPTHERTAAI